MKLISSTPKPRHDHRNGTQLGWFLKRFPSRFLNARFIISVAWLLFVIIVGVLAIAFYHLMGHFVETVAGQG